MITTVSASEDNTTDTIGATDNIEICTVSIDESIGEISAPTLNAIDTSTKSTNEKRNINDSDTLLESNMNEEINKEYDDVDSNGENNDFENMGFANSKNNPEILGISDNQEILGAVVKAFSVSSASVNQIIVSVTVQFKTSDCKGETYTVTASCNGYSGSFTATKTDLLGFSQTVSGTITINGVFAPGQYTVTGTDGKSATATVSKATPSGISATGGSSYTFGVEGSPVVYKGKVNGKKGSVSMAGNVYIYQNAKLVKTVTCDADGSFTYSLDNSTCLRPSDYTYTCYYGGNTYYNGYGSADSLQAPKTITVSISAPEFTICDKITINYNQTGDVVLNGSVFKYSGAYYGNIDLYIGDELVGSDIPVSSDGSWTYTLSSTRIMPNTNSYSVKVDYKDSDYSTANIMVFDDKYSVSKGIIVPSINPTGDIDIGDTEYVEVSIINAMGTGNIPGITVSLSGTGISGSLVNVSDSNGMVLFTVPNLPGGNYDDWKVSVTGNDYYNGRVMNVKSFYVQSPLNVIITGISPNNSTYPDEIIVTGFTDGDQGIPQGNVTLTLGGMNYTGFFDSNGNFTASLIGVKPGIYNNIIVKYNPTVDEYYRGVESTVSIPETG